MNTFDTSHATIKRSVMADLGRVALATGLVLLVPLAAMGVTQEVNWSAFDFAVAAVLLLGAGSAYVAISRKLKATRQRIIATLALAFGFVLLWAELAVGIFNSPIAGS